MYLYRGRTREQWRTRERVARAVWALFLVSYGVAFFRHEFLVAQVALLGWGVAMFVTLRLARIVRHPERYFTLAEEPVPRSQ